MSEISIKCVYISITLAITNLESNQIASDGCKYLKYGIWKIP